MDQKQLRNLVRKILGDSDLIKYDDERDVELLMLTAATESHLGHYIHQVNGIALGIFQMEPNTEKDIWENYLRYNRDLSAYIKEYINEDWNFGEELEWNLAYQILMARVHYLRVKEAIPPKNDTVGLAKYYKKYYNTYLGKSTTEKATEKYNKYVK